MKTSFLIAPALAVAAAAAGTGWWLSRSDERPDEAATPASGSPTATDHAANPTAGGLGDTDTTPAGDATNPAPTAPADAGTSGTAPRTERTATREEIVWPVTADAAKAAAAKTDAATTGKQLVPTELAFEAMQYVGVDPEAEKLWLRAIQDPNMPAETRADLIEDLNEQGYHDNDHPDASDLPLILARLRLIERLLPEAKDEVNRAAFEEAYKDLLEMYVRLGGKEPVGKKAAEKGSGGQQK
ncbi:MAG: hypothetical protein KDE27_14095 [Planctomycetes bacterium]|nr:hypothetical protein [Planctomycetota bacterium]